MSFSKEFKDFAMRGNVVDLAVGVIIGGAFGKISTSLVNDIIMPPVGLLLGEVEFKALKLNIGGNNVAINYGMFLSTIIDFLLIAFVVFLLIKAINSLKRTDANATAPTTRACPECLSAIPVDAKRCCQCTSVLKA